VCVRLCLCVCLCVSLYLYLCVHNVHVHVRVYVLENTVLVYQQSDVDSDAPDKCCASVPHYNVPSLKCTYTITCLYSNAPTLYVPSKLQAAYMRL
jgi:hypothetical protein